MRYPLSLLACALACACASPSPTPPDEPPQAASQELAPVRPEAEPAVILLALFRPSTNFPTTNPFEHPTFPAHAEYMEMLHAEGIVSRGGSFADLSGALLEFLWDDPEEIDRVLQEEPFVLEDVWTYEILAWVQSL